MLFGILFDAVPDFMDDILIKVEKPLTEDQLNQLTEISLEKLSSLNEIKKAYESVEYKITFELNNKEYVLNMKRSNELIAGNVVLRQGDVAIQRNPFYIKKDGDSSCFMMLHDGVWYSKKLSSEEASFLDAKKLVDSLDMMKYSQTPFYVSGINSTKLFPNEYYVQEFTIASDGRITDINIDSKYLTSIIGYEDVFVRYSIDAPHDNVCIQEPDWAKVTIIETESFNEVYQDEIQN